MSKKTEKTIMAVCWSIAGLFGLACALCWVAWATLFTGSEDDSLIKFVVFGSLVLCFAFMALPVAIIEIAENVQDSAEEADVEKT